jgi:hypothetical protein
MFVSDSQILKNIISWEKYSDFVFGISKFFEMPLHRVIGLQNIGMGFESNEQTLPIIIIGNVNP